MIQKYTYLMIHFIANKSSILEDRADIEKFTESTKTASQLPHFGKRSLRSKLLIASRFSVTPILVGRFKF